MGEGEGSLGEGIKETLQVLENYLHKELCFVARMVILTHFLADFSKEV